MNILETNNKTKCLGIVNATRQGETTSNHLSLVMCNGTIRMLFEGEDPLAHDNVGICWTGNQGPSPTRN